MYAYLRHILNVLVFTCERNIQVQKLEAKHENSQNCWMSQFCRGLYKRSLFMFFTCLWQIFYYL